MIPISLVLENFQGYSKSEILFDDISSALIVGKTKSNDLESNGVGKSTIFKAIEYVLFNKISAKQTDKIIRDDTDFCKVQFIFSEDDSIFKIERLRSRKSNSSDLRLYKKNTDSTWEDKTQRRIGDNEKEIEKLIKISYEAFKNSVLFSQKSDNDLASLTPEKRKALFKETLQLNHFIKYEKLAKKKISDLTKDIEKNKNLLTLLGTPSKDIQELEDLTKNIEIFKIEKEKNLVIFKNNLNILNSEYLEFSSKYQLLEKESNEFASKQKIIQTQIEKLQLNLSDYSKKLSNLESEGRLDVSNLKALKSQFEEENKKTLRDLSEIEIDNKKISEFLVDKSSSLKTLQFKVNELMIPLPINSICNHCRQVLSENHRKECQKEIQEQLKDSLSSIENIKKDISLHNKEQQALLLESNEINRSIKIKYDLNVKLESKKKDVDSKRKLYSEYLELFNKTKLEFNQKTQEIEDLNKKQFIDNLNEFSKLKSNINDIKSKIILIQNSIETTTRNLSELETRKSIALNKLDQRKIDSISLVEINKNISKLEDEFHVMTLVIQSFGSSGIPSLIIHNILDDFQIETNNWLAQLKPGIQLKFSIIKDNKSSGEQEDTLDLSFFIHGKERDYDQISGGQRLAISLSLRLGLIEILNKQLGTKIKMLLLDEVDQPLDEVGLEYFSDIIRELQKNFKILVITHNKGLKDKFKHALCVEQDENHISTVKLVSSW